MSFDFSCGRNPREERVNSCPRSDPVDTMNCVSELAGGSPVVARGRVGGVLGSWMEGGGAGMLLCTSGRTVRLLREDGRGGIGNVLISK